MNTKTVTTIVILTVVSVGLIIINGLALPVGADKDCSIGKSLKGTYGTPRDGNELGSVFSNLAKNDPGRIGDAATAVNEFCHGD